jgi:hypothetical protein
MVDNKIMVPAGTTRVLCTLHTSRYFPNYYTHFYPDCQMLYGKHYIRDVFYVRVVQASVE